MLYFHSPPAKKNKATAVFLCVLIYSLLIFMIWHHWTASPGLPADYKDTPRPRIVFYNRIPKSGSTTLTNAIAYDLCALNGFHVAHLNLTGNRFQMAKSEQATLARNLTGWHQLHPIFVHGHIAFVDFESFGLPRPVWINLVREPFDRFLSYFYFLRHGDNFRVGLRRSKAGNNETFDECFLRGAKECDPSAIWLQIPYFCGTAHVCSQPGSQRALEQAKRHLVERYLLVGVTERMDQMPRLLEMLLPDYFRGAEEHFRSLDAKRAHLRHTTRKMAPSEDVERQFKSHPVYKMERDFYDFALAEFDAVWRRAEAGRVGGGSSFHFEKMRP